MRHLGPLVKISFLTDKAAVLFKFIRPLHDALSRIANLGKRNIDFPIVPDYRWTHAGVVPHNDDRATGFPPTAWWRWDRSSYVVTFTDGALSMIGTILTRRILFAQR